MPEPHVVVVGSINRDLVVEAAAFPAPGETIVGTAVRSSAGGKGANQAVAAARGGARVAMAGRVGNDEPGRAALAALQADGVGTELVEASADEPTGTALITVAEGDNTIVVVAGANADWPPGWPAGDTAARAVLEGADVVLAQLEVPVEVVLGAATAAGGLFVLNAAPAAALPDELLARCDVLVVNEHELEVVAGTVSRDGLGSVHETLRGRGVGVVVTTLGARGAVVTDDSGTHELASPTAAVVDTTGAGDAFTGVLCARLGAGESTAQAARWAVLAGSLAVRSAGTRDSYPDVATLTAMLDAAAP